MAKRARARRRIAAGAPGPRRGRGNGVCRGARPAAVDPGRIEDLDRVVERARRVLDEMAVLESAFARQAATCQAKRGRAGGRGAGPRRGRGPASMS